MLWSLLNNVVPALRAFFVGRTQSALEILALRQQLAVLRRKRPCPKLNPMDRLFWTALRRLWSGWAEALLIVKPETVVRWHRAGFRLYWRWRSRGPVGGRGKITLEIRELIQRMARENPTWGAPKIHGELLKLGFTLSERSVSRYLHTIQRRGDPGKHWLAGIVSDVGGRSNGLWFCLGQSGAGARQATGRRGRKTARISQSI